MNTPSNVSRFNLADLVPDPTDDIAILCVAPAGP